MCCEFKFNDSIFFGVTSFKTKKNHSSCFLNKKEKGNGQSSTSGALSMLWIGALERKANDHGCCRGMSMSTRHQRAEIPPGQGPLIRLRRLASFLFVLVWSSGWLNDRNSSALSSASTKTSTSLFTGFPLVIVRFFWTPWDFHSYRKYSLIRLHYLFGSHKISSNLLLLFVCFMVSPIQLQIVFLLFLWHLDSSDFRTFDSKINHFKWINRWELPHRLNCSS